MGFNATFNNISVTSWRWVLLVEETGVPKYSKCNDMYTTCFRFWLNLNHLKKNKKTPHCQNRSKIQ